jgi:metal-dependent HD superfamily phosphatase/phosphodiesterase
MDAYIRMCGMFCPQCLGYKDEHCKGTELQCEKTACDVYKCLKKKGIRYCFQCTEFPDRTQCKIFTKVEEDLHKIGLDINENLNIIQKSGEKDFIKKIKK